MRKIGYTALCLYLLFVGLSATIPHLLVPTSVMAALALIASLGVFLDLWVPKNKNS